MNEALQQLMREATRLTRAGQLDEATRAIQRALNPQPVPTPTAPGAVAPSVHADTAPKPGAVTLDATATVPGGNVFAVDASHYDAAEAAFADAEVAHHEGLHASPDFTVEQAHPDVQVDAGEGDFTAAAHTYLSKTLRYKLYAPPGQGSKPMPLIVMLHGCTQNADDFAAGTGMNAAAHAQGIFVLYPEQSQSANASGCWNWFQPTDQHRGLGEPAFIASLTEAVMKQYNIDPARVYIAGLSAGGAMATIVAEAYPEIFAAVGVHSGLPRGAANSVMEAFTVMRSGDVAAPVAGIRMQVSVPTIVFHGDKDQTVHPRHGERVIAAVLSGGDAAHWQGAAGGSPRIEKGTSAKGRRYTRATYHDDKGNAMLEHWLVHGAGHAWSGGHAAGSFTDAKGPDATTEMLRFFMGHPRA